MYGKLFASAFTGSMVGSGAIVFALWAYVISNAKNSRVELNPKLLSAILGEPEDKVMAAINFLCSPDESSRSKDYDGKRLIREGQFQYFIPTYEHYRAIRNEDDRREYNRQKKAESRARTKSPSVNDGQ